MEPLVLQLEAECLDSQVSILEVLRKALVVARKLELTDAQVWISKELNGYKPGDEAPRYRLLTGQIRSWNPYQGCWIPVVFEDHREATHLSKCFAGQPIGELVELVKSREGGLHFPFDPRTEANLLKGMDVPLQTTRLVNWASLSGIMDAVRNMILEWCLQLEKDGILGEGLVFSAREKEVAAHSNYVINYNAPVTHSQIQQGSPHATQGMQVAESDRENIQAFIGLLNDHLSELKLATAEEQKLKTTVRQIETQVASPNPSHGALRQSLQTIRNVLEGCAGSLIASGPQFEIGKLLLK